MLGVLGQPTDFALQLKFLHKSEAGQTENQTQQIFVISDIGMDVTGDLSSLQPLSSS